MMKKYKAIFVIAFLLGLFCYSCNSNQDIATPTPTSIIQQISIPTHSPIYPTSTFTPTSDNIVEKGGLITTLGDKVDRQGWWSAIPAFSPDGKIIALVSDRVQLWNVETHELAQELFRPYPNCHALKVAYSTDGRFLATSSSCATDTNAGHVFIWDTKNGELLQEWEQKFSKNTSENKDLSNSASATGLTFLPESSLLAFANGNAIEIRDVREGGKSENFELGDDMVATDIAVSSDSKRLFAFMDTTYFKTSNRIAYKYALQVWDLELKKIIEQTAFPEPENAGFFIGHFDVEMKLSDKFLLSTDYINDNFSITNLEAGTTINPSFRGDVKAYVSQDINYVLYLPKVNGFDCKTQSIELWSTNLDKLLYSFTTSNEDFHTMWCFGPHTIVFSPNNAILAIAHEERVTLWDISSFTKSKESTIP